MKYYLSALITCLSVGFCYGQLNLNRDKIIAANDEAVTALLKSNHVDYALVAWYTSNWSRSEHSFYCMIKQNGNWYMAVLTSPESELPAAFNLNLKVRQAALSAHGADSLMNTLKPDSAFLYPQSTLAKLASLPVTYTKDGMGYQFKVDDAGVFHLLKFEQGEASYRVYYAPDEVLKAAYPYNPQYGILRGMVNTAGGLSSATKNLKLW